MKQNRNLAWPGSPLPMLPLAQGQDVVVRRSPGRCHARALLAGLSLVSIAPMAQAQPSPDTQSAGAQAAPAPDKFMIAAFDVSGVTKLAPGEIERLLYPYVGPDRTEKDAMAAQKALQDAYNAKGFEAVLVELPVQPDETFRQGIIQIAVNESPVGRVRVVGARHHALSVVRKHVPSLVEGQPVNLAALQRDVEEANRFPDRTIDPVFRPGQVPGTLDVDLKVDDSRPFHVNIDLNNDNSPNTRELRLAGTARYTNLWERGHTISFTYSVAPQDRKQSEVYSASYNAPLIGTPWSFLVYGYNSNSNVAALGGTNVLGNGMQIGLRATYRLPSRDNFQQISFGPDFKDFKEQIFLQGEMIRPTPIRYVPLVAEYTLAGATETASYGVTLGATAGLRVIKRRTCVDLGSAQIPDQAATCDLPDGGVGVPEDQFQGRAIDARENFFHLNLDANYSRNIFGGLTLGLRLSGQLADSSLVTNEQFSIGGMSSVRGYYVSEAVGDDGVAGSIELQSPELATIFGRGVDELRFFAFGDAGYARVRRPALEQESTFKLGSLGGGVRLRALGYFSAEFLVGVPLTGGPVTEKGDPRYSFSVKGEF